MRRGDVWQHTSGAVGAVLPDGRRHFQHGPIDLVIDCDGPPTACRAAFRRAWEGFAHVLPTLVAELPTLRRPVGPPLRGPVARRMRAAGLPHGAAAFVTPMAAVAGAVADHVLAALVSDGDIERAYVNNGGDIALHLTPGHSYRAGVVFDYGAPKLNGLTEISAADPVRGIATSGWQGRSLSLGIADSVTVLAASAAAADVAATLIANAVDTDHPAIDRRPASALDPDNDLDDRPVTVAVGALPADAVARALDAGAAVARRMQEDGLLAAALLTLAGETRQIDSKKPLAAAQQRDGR